MIIEFKCKAQERQIIVDGTFKTAICVRVPDITKMHCDMNAFRNSKKFGSWANSDLFTAIVKRELRNLDIGKFIDIDNLPDYISIKPGFLTVTTIDLSQAGLV
jgi:hypothetical protein